MDDTIDIPAENRKCDICGATVPTERAVKYFDAGLDWCLCAQCVEGAQRAGDEAMRGKQKPERKGTQ